MRRLSNHFKYYTTLDEGHSTNDALPAEKPNQRPPILHGKFHGHPLWFHRLETNDGHHDETIRFESDEGRILQRR